MEEWKPLITKRQMKMYEKHTGQPFDKQRRSGRTTAIALKTIAEAMQNPCKKIEIYDHYDSHQARDLMVKTIISICERLEFRGFLLTRNPFAIEFRIFEE